MRVVVEVRAAGAVVQEPGSIGVGHALDERLRIAAPFVVEQRQHGDRDFLDLFELAVASGVNEALVEGDVPHPIGARIAVHDLREEVGVAPLRIHVRHGQEAVEVVKADMLRLAFAVLAHVPLADRLRDVARVGEQLRQRDLALQPAGHAVHRRDQQTVPHREPSRHDRRPGRRARRLAVARCQE